MDLRELQQRGSATVVRHPWELARAEVVSRLLARTIGPGQVGNLLDLGCGDTFLAEHITKRFPGSTVAAVDTAFDDATRSAIAARLGGRPISLYDSLDQAQRHESKDAGLVLLLDVIEHVEDDVALLRSLRQFPFIRADAWLLITVPAYQSLFCSHDRFLGHYRRYTNGSLAECTRRAGYVPQRVGYFFASLLLPRYLQVRKERAHPPTVETSGLVEWSGGAGRTSLLRNALLLDFEVSWAVRALGIKLPGLSNYLLCRRSA